LVASFLDTTIAFRYGSGANTYSSTGADTKITACTVSVTSGTTGTLTTYDLATVTSCATGFVAYSLTGSKGCLPCRSTITRTGSSGSYTYATSDPAGILSCTAPSKSNAASISNLYDD